MLTPEDISTIESTLSNLVISDSILLNKSEVFHAVKNKLSSKLKLPDFNVIISNAIRLGEIKGYEMSGIHIKKTANGSDGEKAAETKPIVKPVEKPKAPEERKMRGPGTTLNTRRSLWIKDSMYFVPLTMGAIEVFLNAVLLAKIDPDGKVVFNGKRYNCDEALLHRFLTSFVGCGNPTVSDPIESTVDADGVPLILK